MTLFIGQGHGFIRLANDREVFFHRSDVLEVASLNDFAVIDAVQFHLLEDEELHRRFQVRQQPVSAG